MSELKLIIFRELSVYTNGHGVIIIGVIAPQTVITGVYLSLSLTYYVFTLLGLVFAAVCFLFNVTCRNRRWAVLYVHTYAEVE